jgi:hypothetical protein
MKSTSSSVLLALAGAGFVALSAWPGEPVWPRALDGARLEISAGREVALLGVADRREAGKRLLGRLLARAGASLHCEERDWDATARRPLAVCWIGEDEINAAMIGHGFAAVPAPAVRLSGL